MARPPTITRHSLAPLLLNRREPVSATELAAAMRVNRTTVVRALAAFGDDLVVMGATRSTRYALRRTVQNAGRHWPLYVIDKAGVAQLWATLEALHDRRWRVIWAGMPPQWAHQFSDREGMWDGFPFFLADVRPEGFLGRAIARQVARPLGVPEDPRQWSDDHTVVYLQAAGEDSPGALVVGDECLRRALARIVFPGEENEIHVADAERCYPMLAERVAASLPGSSAGGEQPKFLTMLDDGTGALHPVLVKFSPPMNQLAGQRWADLLLAEYHAVAVLAEHGMAHYGARVLDAGGRRFLEVPRFDRTASGGRRGVVSLAALHPAAIGHGSGTAWPVAAAELQREGLISANETIAVQRRHAFGELIGNSDMHAGNLAFWLDDALPFRITPAYDMLPMLWAPGVQGEIMARQLSPAPPLPAALAPWQEAAAWASEFWQRFSDDPRLSADFQEIARGACTAVQTLRAHVG